MHRRIVAVFALLLTLTLSTTVPFSLHGQEQDKQPGKTEEPAKSKEPAKTEEPAKTKEPAKSQPEKASPTKEPAASKNAAPAAPATATSSPFAAKFDEFKKIIARLRQLQLDYASAKPADRKPIEEEYDRLIKQGDAMQGELNQLAETEFAANPNKDPEVGEFLAEQVQYLNSNDRFEEALQLAKPLIDHEYTNKRIYDLAGSAAFAANDFDNAEKYFKIANDAKVLSEGQKYTDLVPKEKAKWEKERQLRAAESKADDLPRVKLKTNKGDIVLELFENEAPNTVANFISLIEKKFYDGVVFHRVLSGFMAQGGDPKGTGMGGPGHTIKDELGENHRNHFRGTLSMAKTSAPDTGGSQFFLCFVPTANLDGVHTVFGRVMEGLDVLAKLQRRNPEESQVVPDKIIEATVVRKRPHEYKPETLADKK